MRLKAYATDTPLSLWRKIQCLNSVKPGKRIHALWRRVSAGDSVVNAILSLLDNYPAMFRKRQNSQLNEEEEAKRQVALSERLQKLATVADRLADANRTLPRKRALHLALVRLSSDRSVSCTVRDITSRGFRLEFTEEIDLPKTCDIEIPVLAEKFRIEIRWQNENSAGVEIIETNDTADVA